MESKSALGVVLAFGLAFSLLAGSGVGGLIFGENPGDESSVETLEDITEDANLEDDSEGSGLGADVSGDNEPTVIGLALSAGQFVVQLVVAIGLLPITLARLGFPTWFAFPAGGILQIIGIIGLAQFVTGRILQ